MSELPILLVATDDLMTATRLREAARACSYETINAKTAEAVWENLCGESGSQPVAILVSLSGRRLDGLDLIRRLKADPQVRKLPILAFAGHIETEKHEAARTAGVDMVAANSSVALHLGKLLPRLLGGESSDSLEEEDDEA